MIFIHVLALLLLLLFTTDGVAYEPMAEQCLSLFSQLFASYYFIPALPTLLIVHYQTEIFLTWNYRRFAPLCYVGLRVILLSVMSRFSRIFARIRLQLCSRNRLVSGTLPGRNCTTAFVKHFCFRCKPKEGSAVLLKGFTLMHAMEMCCRCGWGSKKLAFSFLLSVHKGCTRYVCYILNE